MVQIIVTYIQTKKEKYYQEKDGAMEKIEKLSDVGEVYRWWFYNEAAESEFLDGYIYGEIEGIPAENVKWVHENAYLKQSF